MYGAILGDIIGEPYGFGGNPKTKDFPLFRAVPFLTDDMHTVMREFDKKVHAIAARWTPLHAMYGRDAVSICCKTVAYFILCNHI